ncbi:hypothetical protein [Proteus faecis]|uniref:Uncharacterized protein n=1 Tax=Proteus faecis TaxID=2050967 RepID=A0AAW7CSP3_9GAMM|nr:hypothetical protein [Proteus faecis]MBG3012390.1 hypothetical protein [Proteus mirabilis]MDL5167138.1 hypothetical protein [Proteus faecis]MDL5275208.1 hypothetical protein [Proteus faecis]MDL5278777.1 hypothetical protein [Proteus faecis]MDL5307779.1 hypothetical protein [Proteus faecis]
MKIAFQDKPSAIPKRILRHFHFYVTLLPVFAIKTVDKIHNAFVMRIFGAKILTMARLSIA